MSIATALTRCLNLAHPIIQAPLAGGGDTPELVAVASNAGALGFIGAAYLIFLGLRAVFSKTNVLEKAGTAPSAKRGRRFLRDGFLLQMSNPKAIIFFTALLPQFIDPRRAGVAPQVSSSA